MKKVTIFGGTGFLGREITSQLAEKGFMVNVVARNARAASDIKLYGPVGKVILSNVNINDAATVNAVVSTSDIVINTVGILFEKGKNNFRNIHVAAVKNISEACRKNNIKKFIHISALGVDSARSSLYAKTKFEAEATAQKNFPEVVILRPSIIFGERDNFFNMFACMAKFSPALPLIGGGKTKFQPVYVGDVAEAVIKTIENDDLAGEIIEIAGPKIYSFKELLQYILHELDLKRTLLPLPFILAEIIGSMAKFLPKPPLTRDQVVLLKYDNVLSGKHKTIESLGITPKYLETIVPAYLRKYKK